MVAALEQAWASIRSRHADVPAAVVILGAGSIGTPAGTLRLGHFAATRWDRDTGDAERLAEVFIGGEGLARGPAVVLGTLLHEAAHAIAHVRGVRRVAPARCRAGAPSEPCVRVSSHTAQASRWGVQVGSAVLLRCRACNARLQ